jgi:hypothetical protein
MATKPVVYIIHGAWHGPVYFDGVVSLITHSTDAKFWDCSYNYHSISDTAAEE